jgi:hypothetical protein
VQLVNRSPLRLTMSARLFFAPACNMRGVDPQLVRALGRWREVGSGAAVVLEGWRTVKAQAERVKAGTSRALAGLHTIGRAIDVMPCDDEGNALWPEHAEDETERERRWALIERLGCELFEVFDGMNVAVQNGNDWDGDGTPTGRDRNEGTKLVDPAHWQLPWPANVARALEGAARRNAARERGERPVR